MVSALVLSLWENRKRLHITDVVLNSNLIDYNFIGCTSETALLEFIKKYKVDVIDIKTTFSTYNINVRDIESFSDEPVYYEINLKGGKKICLL